MLARSVTLLVAACATVLRPDSGRAEPTTIAEESALELTIADAATGDRVAARVRLRDESGTDHMPEEVVEVRIGPDRWFVADGLARVPVPPGRLYVRVERGTEYRPVLAAVDVAAHGVTRHQATLSRWIDMRERGYASGENHLHVSPEALGAMLAAEDLDFGTSLSWWNGPQFSMPGDGPVRILPFAGHRAPATVLDAEVERVWGAVYLIGLTKPMHIEPEAGRSNLPFVRLARDQGALVCYQGGWSREVLLDALLGYVDVVNVCNNNFHRHRFQPRPQYSNLLEIEGFPQYPDTPEAMLRMNTDTYYRLLNCGLKLAAGAGSATGAKTTPVGYNRAYVRVGRPSDVLEFLESWRRGRGFVTNGPMVFLTVAGSSSPGDAIALPEGGGTLEARVSAVSDQPLRSLEIVVNGAVAAAVPGANLAPETREAALTATLHVKEGCWIAARATAEDRLLSDEEMAGYDSPGTGSRLARPCRLLFAHTSPVYVCVNGLEAAVPASLDEAARMLDGFERFAEGAAAQEHRHEILEALQEARARLRSGKGKADTGG